jgi:DNA-binding MarR family transcriptional regulator
MNETKQKILECLSDGNWRTSSDVAQWCGLQLTNASELLRRYRWQGLVTRERNYHVPRGFLYKITTIGVERLKYFNSGVALTSSSMADYIGLSGEKKQIFEQWVSKKLGGI